MSVSSSLNSVASFDEDKHDCITQVVGVFCDEDFGCGCVRFCFVYGCDIGSPNYRCAVACLILSRV